MDDNIKNLQDAMDWLYRSIREEAELDGEMSNDHAIQLGFIQNMLEKFPRRNCEVGTVEEQIKRYEDFCRAHTKLGGCTGCPLIQYRRCQIAWGQMPYEKGGDK